MSEHIHVITPCDHNCLCGKSFSECLINYHTRAKKAEAERDDLRERVGPIMAYLVMMLAAYDTDPNEPLEDDVEISSFCASGASGALTVGMVRKALEHTP